MKIRSGFVSNSSSSSFIVKTKKEKLSEEEILKHLKLEKDSPLYFVAKDFVNIVKSALSEDNKLTLEKIKREYLWREDKYETEEELLDLLEENTNFSRKELLDIKEGKWNIYEDSVCDDDWDNMMGVYMCRHGVNIKTDNFEILCEPY